MVSHRLFGRQISTDLSPQFLLWSADGHSVVSAHKEMRNHNVNRMRHATFKRHADIAVEK